MREPPGQPQRVPVAAGVEVRREGRDYVIEVRAIAIANTIAYLSEMVDPISIFLSLTREI